VVEHVARGTPRGPLHESDCNPTSALFTPDFFVSKRFNQQIRATCMDMFSGGGGPHLNEGKCKILCDVLQLNLDLSILMHLARSRSRPCMWWCAIHTAAQLFAVTHWLASCRCWIRNACSRSSVSALYVRTCTVYFSFC
jgi:hypothetical protein